MPWDQQVFIAQANVDHFRSLLAGALAPDHRATLTELLADEEAKLCQLRAAAAERDLAQLLPVLACNAVQAFKQAPEAAGSRRFGDLDLALDDLPCGMALIEETGGLFIANAEMRRFLPRSIPSRDAEEVGHWSFPSPTGPLNPFFWPGARALRGEAVNPGIDATYTSDDGSSFETRVAAVPVSSGKGQVIGAIVAVYDMAELGRPGVDQTLSVLVSAAVRSVPGNQKGSG